MTKNEKRLLDALESCVNTLRSVEALLEEQVDRLARGQRPQWAKAASTASDTARLVAEEAEPLVAEFKAGQKQPCP